MTSRGQGKRLRQATMRRVLGFVISMCITQHALGETALLGVDSSGAFLIDAQSSATLVGLESSSVIVSTQGIRGSGVRGDDDAEGLGIRGSGVRGIRGSGVRGIRGSGVRGIRGSGVRGIRGSGVRGIRGSGVRGIRGSGVRGIRGSGVRGIRGSGLRSDGEAETLGIRGSGLRDGLNETQQGDSGKGIPLLAIGPVTHADAESISVLGAELQLAEDSQVIAVDSSGQISTLLASEHSSAVTVGDYVAVGGFDTGDPGAAKVIVVSPDAYLDGSSSVYLRGTIANAQRGSAKLELHGTNVDYSGALWSIQNDDVGNGLSAEFAGVAHSGVIYATGGGLLNIAWLESQASNATAESQGIRGSGVRGIRGSGVRGDDDAEGLGIRGSGVRGIRGSGVRGIRGSGVRGIRGSGLRSDGEAEALGIRGSGVR